MLRDGSLDLRRCISDASFHDLGWKYLDDCIVCTEFMVGKVYLYVQLSIHGAPVPHHFSSCSFLKLLICGLGSV